LRVCSSILTLLLDTVHVTADGYEYTKRGKVVFVDLAGSEREARSLVQGAAAAEARKINLSLLCLVRPL
jgi:hypothetical protein